MTSFLCLDNSSWAALCSLRFKLRPSRNEMFGRSHVRQNVGELARVPALWRGAATERCGPPPQHAKVRSLAGERGLSFPGRVLQ